MILLRAQRMVAAMQLDYAAEVKSRMAGSSRKGIVAGLLIAASTSMLPFHEGSAQVMYSPADSLIRVGALDQAESIFYRAARARPRDPAVRLALGRYIAARGGARVGAVLIEEAREFGLDPQIAATHLAPLYVRLGDYRSLARLAPSPVPLHQRSRVRWLASNPPAVSGVDSVVLPTRRGDSRTLFSFPVVLLGDTVWVGVETGMLELTFSPALATNATAEFFGTQEDRNRVAALRELRLGGMRMINVPVTFDRGIGRSSGRVGIDFLRQFSPTYDPVAQRITLRRTGRVAQTAAGERLPVLHEATAAFVVIAGSLQPFFAEQPSRLLRDRRWTWDARRGLLLVE